MNLSEREAASIVSLWCQSKAGRAAIAVNTRRSITARAKRLCDFLNRDEPLSEETIVRLLNQKGMYSQLHKLSKTLIGICKWAVENGILDKNPLFRVKLPCPKYDHRKFWLTQRELDLIETAPIAGRLGEIRDIFLLQCFTGLAYSDVKRISRNCVYEVAGFKWLRIARLKTGRYPIVLLTEKVREILDRLDWRIDLPTNQVYNRELKEIKAICRLEKQLFSHLACKTFVQLELERGASLSATATRRGINVKTLTDHYGTVTEKVIIAEERQLQLQFNYR